MCTDQRIRRNRGCNSINCLLPRGLRRTSHYPHKPLPTNFQQQSDPGILINIYQTLTSYTIPGPRPLTCGAGSGSTATAAPTTLATSTKTTSTTTSKATTTSSAPAAGQTLYGQCGGTGWTGPVTCASGTCKVSSTYYSKLFFCL